MSSQMAASSQTHYLRSIMPSVPTEMASKIRQICIQTSNETLLENLVRFLTGAPHTTDASEDLRRQWTEKQSAVRDVISSLNPSNSDRKRTRSDDDEMTDVMADTQQVSKRQRLTAASSQGTPTPKDFGNPIFTLNSISATSPVRKKVDITVHENAIVFANSSTKAVEGSVPVPSIKRSFIVPTRGKYKPHWTVILLSGDVPDNPKAKSSGGSENQQVIFGLDANSTAAFTTTSYADSGAANSKSHPKNSPTLLHIQTFLSHLNIPVIFPSTSTFKSACGGVLAGASASADGIPGVEAYRAAKAGNLWFSEEGVLWGESKPCEFWSVKDLIGRDDGVKVVGMGRTCTVVLTRRLANASGEDEGEDEGEETEFGMVDGRERESIYAWVRNHRHLFGSDSKGQGKGKEVVKSKPMPAGPLTIQNLPDDSDDEDEEFKTDSASDDGSTSDESSSESAGSPAEEGDLDEGGDDSDLDDEDNGGELDPAHHPLLRAGALPRMSKSVRDMVVGMVEEEFIGTAGQEAELDEEDELED